MSRSTKRRCRRKEKSKCSGWKISRHWIKVHFGMHMNICISYFGFFTLDVAELTHKLYMCRHQTQKQKEQNQCGYKFRLTQLPLYFQVAMIPNHDLESLLWSFSRLLCLIIIFLISTLRSGLHVYRSPLCSASLNLNIQSVTCSVLVENNYCAGCLFSTVQSRRRKRL